MGGGCRKNKRSSSSSSSTSKRVQDQAFTPNPNSLIGLPSLSYDSSDLTLALARLQKQSCGQLGYDDHDLSMLGNHHTNTPCGDNILGMHHHSSSSSTNPGFLDALRSGFLGTQSSNMQQNLYYGYGNGDMGEVDNGNAACGGEMMMMPYNDQEMSVASTQAVTVTTMKQEICNGREPSSESRVLWGFPWQFNNADTNMGG